MWCSSSSPNAGKTVPDVGLTGIMARTSPPVLHRFIDELSFWDSPSSADKAKDKRFNTKRRNVPFYQQALEERGSCDSMVDEAETSPTLSPSSQSASVWKTAVDKTSGRVYYYDSVTRRTQWGKPEEIRSQERRRKQERRRRDRKFFDEMEANILKALERGEMIPGVPNSQTPKEGPPQEPLAHRKPRVRTISGMDDVLLAELRDDSNVKRQDHHQHVQIPVSKTSPVAAPAAAASTTVGRPPLPRPPSSKSHITANDDMVLSPDPVDDDEAKHPFQNQQQRSSATDLELAGEKLLDAPIHSEWTECVGEELGAAMATLGPPTCHTRRNTGGTIYLQNTMTNPDIKATIRCVCAIIRAHIAQAHSQSSQQQQCLSPEYLVFKDDYGSSSPSKRKHPPIPSLAEVNDFYDAFYRRSQMEHDTIITSLIYVERLIKDTNGALTPDPENWHSVLFACMVLASKVWDDLSMVGPALLQIFWLIANHPLIHLFFFLSCCT